MTTPSSLQPFNFQEYFEFSKNKIQVDWIPTDFMYKRCNPNTLEANVIGINKTQINNIRKTAMTSLPTFAIEYFDFVQLESDILPEKIALIIQTLPLVPKNYKDVFDFDSGYYQCELIVNAFDDDFLVFPSMIDFEKFNTPLSISKTAVKTPLFKLKRGDFIHIHCYISKGTPNKNVRWTSVNTFIYESNNINPYSVDYHIKIETNGSIDPKMVFEKSVEILNEEE